MPANRVRLISHDFVAFLSSLDKLVPARSFSSEFVLTLSPISQLISISLFLQGRVVGN